MRNIFINTLIDIAKEDDKLVLLMAEVGYGVVEPFERLFPERFYNTGISEQNLVLTAAGLAIQGYHPVAYSMASFLPTRAFEMIKDSICYQNLPVTLVGIGSGASYGEMGTTHHGLEEEALMTSLPNMTVMFPADAGQCKAAVRYALNSEGPAYIGLEKINVKDETQEIDDNPLSWKKIRDGSDGTILACGTLKEEAMQAAEILNGKGINVGIYSVNAVKPFDYTAIEDACATSNLFVIDEHYSWGGFAANLAKYILEQKKVIKNFVDFSFPDAHPDCIYHYNGLKKWAGLSVDNFVKVIEDRITN